MKPSAGYRFCSLPADRELIVSLLPQVSTLAQKYAISEESVHDFARAGAGPSLRVLPQLQLEGFLGCPLGEAELVDRLRFIDSFQVAITDANPPLLAGYCYGYGEAACAALVADGRTRSWEDRELFEHGERHHSRFSVNFQVAVDPAHVGHGLGTRLATAVTQEVAEVESSPCLLWVLLYPFNKMGFRIATKCGFRLAQTFPSTDHDSFIWGELELHRGNGY